MSVEVCSHMGLESSCAENVRDVWADHEAGVDVRAPPNRKRALKLSAGDHAVARDCLKSGFGLGQATLHVEAHRLKKLDTQGIRPYALCVTLFNMSRRLILGAYCVVIGGIPAHNEGILGGSRNFTQYHLSSCANSS